MKRSLRFYFALFFAKGTALVLKLIRRKGTSMPGSWAIILCPDFLGRMPRPKTILGITGTNGKTTVANMVEDVLEDNGYDFVCNRSGTNVHTGVASALIANSTFFGKPKKDLAVFELDERSSPGILPYIKPDILLCTNIFRDSYKRNAHTEFITDILDKYIPKQTRLILNGDDLLCAGIASENERVYFGIEQVDGEGTECKNIVHDITVCPVCDKKLVWDFVRYHHIGRAHCPACGFKSPKLDYSACRIDTQDHEITVKFDGGEKIYPLLNSSMINIYNSISAMVLLTEFGLGYEKIEASMKKMGISETRYHEDKVNDKKVILHLAKGQNPIACSRTFENIKNYPGKKAVVMFLDDYFDAAHSVENSAWLYDTDFEFLNDDSVSQVIIAGARHWDTYVRTLLAGVPKERIVHVEENEKVVDLFEPEKSESVFILYDVYTIGLANRVKEKLKDKIKNETEGENVK